MPRRRRAVITGGARGIGFGIAMAMLDAGYEVTVTGLSEDEIAAVPERTHLSVRRLDVTQAESVAELVERFDELDALVNCAGTIFRSSEYIDTFQRVIDVNLTGTMRMCVASRPKLAAARGTIVNTASMLSFFGGPRTMYEGLYGWQREFIGHTANYSQVGLIAANRIGKTFTGTYIDAIHALGDYPPIGKATRSAMPR